MEAARETVRTLAQVGQTGGRGVLVGGIYGQEGRRGLQRSIVVVYGFDLIEWMVGAYNIKYLKGISGDKGVKILQNAWRQQKKFPDTDRFTSK